MVFCASALRGAHALFMESPGSKQERCFFLCLRVRMFSVSPIWSKYISVALLFGMCVHNAEANRKCLPMIGFLLCGHNKKAGLLSFFVLCYWLAAPWVVVHYKKNLPRRVVVIFAFVCDDA